MGFKHLKEQFEKHRPAGPFDEEGNTLAVSRYLTLLCLFEIAGNLDTIAVCQREIVDRLRANEEKDA